jgi:tetratricopeptide (TPR) repeat protein
VLGMSDDCPAGAVRAFERAVAADPNLGAAWQALGAVRASSDPDAALVAWGRALALMPRNYDLLFNVAVLQRQQGHTEEARAAAERFVREAPPARYARDIETLRAWLSK